MLSSRITFLALLLALSMATTSLYAEDNLTDDSIATDDNTASDIADEAAEAPVVPVEPLPDAIPSSDLDVSDPEFAADSSTVSEQNSTAASDDIATDVVDVPELAEDVLSSETGEQNNTALSGDSLTDPISASEDGAAPDYEDEVIKPNLVLLNVVGANISLELRNSYRVAIAQALGGEYTVFSGSSVDQMLSLEFEKLCLINTDSDSVSTECVQNVAGELQAEFVAEPQVTATDEGYLITLEIKDVFTDQLIKSYAEPCIGCSQLELTQEFRAMITGEREARFCTVTIDTQPFAQGGEISLNGEKQEQTTPATFPLETGEYSLSVLTDDGFGTAVFSCLADAFPRVTVELEITSSAPVAPVVSSTRASVVTAPPPEPKEPYIYNPEKTFMWSIHGIAPNTLQEEENVTGTIDQGGVRLNLEWVRRWWGFGGVGFGLFVGNQTYELNTVDSETNETTYMEADSAIAGASLSLYLLPFLSVGYNFVSVEPAEFGQFTYTQGNSANESFVSLHSYWRGINFGARYISRDDETEMLESDSNAAFFIGWRF